MAVAATVLCPGGGGGVREGRAPPGPGPRAPGRVVDELLPVLGRAGFLDEYAIAVDSGYLIITRIGPVRRWLRRRLHALWGICGLIHPEAETV